MTIYNPPPAGGSGSFTILTTASTVDDSNLAFVFSQKPKQIFINGQGWREGSKSGGVTVWSWSGTTATLAFPVGTGGDIYATA